MKKKYPMQPIYLDEHGVARFKENEAVTTLLNFARQHGLGLNELCTMDFPDQAWEQFNQLIGYSVSGYGDIFGADNQYVVEADKKVEKLLEKQS